jgi:deoxyribodipyrimidine photo-lyase
MTTWIHWFRRDFRLRDNTGLHAAATLAGSGGHVAGAFIIDPRWWLAKHQKLGIFQARFWLESLRELQAALAGRGIPLIVRASSDPVAELLRLAQAIRAEGITYNKEYEPDQIAMDLRLERTAAGAGCRIRSFKDAAIFEEDEILTGNRMPYLVFTPYKRAYLQRLETDPFNVLGMPPRTMSPSFPPEPPVSLRSLGFSEAALESPLHAAPGESGAARLLEHFRRHTLDRYDQTRDIPALTPPISKLGGTSRLSAHLNAGTISIRQVMRMALEPKGRTSKGKSLAYRRARESFLSELIWREFYRMVLFNFPHTVAHSFRENHRTVTWRDDPELFTAWSEGRTGYPIVDAGIRQLLRTGFMHNRLRMITAMFLTKDLDVHWRHGEHFFRRTLVDYDQASNVGGWQWSASTGADAAPYFRIMNPVLQSARFDPEGGFIRHFLATLRRVPNKFIHAPWKMPADIQKDSGCIIGRDYPAPIVDHARARAAAIAKFRKR